MNKSPNATDPMKQRILGAYNPACQLSLAGVVAAVSAMIFAVRGIIDLALVSLMLAGLADMFDGVVARRLRLTNYEKEFGIQLDTTADAVAFVAAPAVIALNTGPASWPVMTGAAIFVIAGVLRLAHFNTLSARGVDQTTHHRGLPVTYVALVFPFLFLLRDSMAVDVFQLLLALTLVVIGILFVTNLPVRRPNRVCYLILPLLAACLIFYWVWHASTA